MRNKMADNFLTRPNSAISDTEEAYYRKRRSFSSGYTIETRKEVLLWSSLSGGDNNYYIWQGDLPKVVPAGSTPTSAGGIGAGLWNSVGNANYLDSLTNNFSNLDTRVQDLEKNPTGKSAYQSYLETTTDNPPLSEAQWVESLKGITGPGLVIKGSFGSVDDLPATGNTPGDAYIIEEQMWVWDSVQWSPVGQVGPEGKSAYQIWLQEGNTGDEAAFLRAIRGAQGPAGPQGQKGEKGDTATGFIFQGVLTSTDLLPQPSNGNINWLYFIDNVGYVSNGSAWVNIGNVRGPQGIQGIQGPAGPQGPQGTQGPQGIQGFAGPSGSQGEVGPGLKIIDKLDDESQLPSLGQEGDAYIIGSDLYVWLTGGESFTNTGQIVGPQGPQGEQGEVGPIGPAGATGPAGRALFARGGKDNVSDLPATGNTVADMYYVAGRTYVWNGTSWVDMGSNVGPQGVDGPQGIKGVDGRSAYQVWLDNGNTGSVNDYLASLTGPKGSKGEKGDQGDIGPGVKILGKLDSTSQLPSTGTLGEGYLIGNDFYVWTGSQYTNVGPIRGPQGLTGPQGDVGPTGPQGNKGDQGIQGSLWIVLARSPGPADGRLGDFYIDSTTNKYYQKTSQTNWAYMGTMGGGNVYDAPNDGKYYQRRNQSWVENTVLEAPADNKNYVRTNKVWVELPASVEEAPKTGGLYARKDGTWASFNPGLSEAPTDGAAYARSSSAWVSVPKEAPNDSLYYVRSGQAWKRFDRYDLAYLATTATLDVSLNNVFTVDLSTARTLNITNLPTNRSMVITVVFSGNAGTVNWTNTIRWTDGVAPSYSATKTTIVILWDGSTLLGFKPGGY